MCVCVVILEVLEFVDSMLFHSFRILFVDRAFSRNTTLCFCNISWTCWLMTYMCFYLLLIFVAKSSFVSD